MILCLGAFSSLLTLNIAELTTTGALAQTGSFYKNKTIKIIVGSTPGGFYDRWARLLAQYMPRYIPGNPTLSYKTCLVGDHLSQRTILSLQANPTD